MIPPCAISDIRANMDDIAEEAAVAHWLRGLPLVRRARSISISFHLPVPGYGYAQRLKAGVGRAWQAIQDHQQEHQRDGHVVVAGAAQGAAGAIPAAGARRPGPPPSPPAGAGAATADFPSFWAFFTSRYSIVLLLLSLLVNRIHAVVPPSNTRYRSSKRVRAIVRAPAILLLARACILILGMTVKLGAVEGAASQGARGGALGFVRMSSAWAARSAQGQLITGRDHSDIMWACFVAASAGVCSESFIRALDHEWVGNPPSIRFPCDADNDLRAH